MGDEQHRHAAPAPQLVEHLEDLRLYGHVQGRRRSSATRISGSAARAIAIITRCLIPPLSWWG